MPPFRVPDMFPLMANWIQKRPWIFVVVAFLILIASWVVLLKLAATHRPEPVPLDKPSLTR